MLRFDVVLISEKLQCYEYGALLKLGTMDTRKRVTSLLVIWMNPHELDLTSGL